MGTTLMVSCQPRISTITAIEGTQTLPQTYENPLDLPGPTLDEPDTTPAPSPKTADVQPEPSSPKQPAEPKLQSQTQTQQQSKPQASPAPPTIPKTLPKTLQRPPAVLLSKKSLARPGLPQASKFIINAEWVMINEGKKIGTPCNFYLSRVLVVSGYSSNRFLATDFDIYAQKNLKNAHVVHFINDGKGSELARLKQHLWSFPQRTPLIMQWSRSGATGHVAIVERVGNMLIIYQASLNKHTARKDYTSIHRLLTGEMRRTLSVYSGF